ncbi:hypothetical protein [Micromonospora sp. NPDC047730]
MAHRLRFVALLLGTVGLYVGSWCGGWRAENEGLTVTLTHQARPAPRSS